MLKICIYIGINAYVTPADAQTDGNAKVEQYSAEAESAKIAVDDELQLNQKKKRSIHKTRQDN